MYLLKKMIQLLELPTKMIFLLAVSVRNVTIPYNNLHTAKIKSNNAAFG